MGHTLQSTTQLIITEQSKLAQFRRALRKEDQIAFDELFRSARFHVAPIGSASHLLPFEAMLLAMQLENQKRTIKVENLVTKFLELVDENQWLDPGCLSLPSGDAPVGHRRGFTISLFNRVFLHFIFRSRH